MLWLDHLCILCNLTKFQHSYTEASVRQISQFLKYKLVTPYSTIYALLHHNSGGVFALVTILLGCRLWIHSAVSYGNLAHCIYLCKGYHDPNQPSTELKSEKSRIKMWSVHTNMSSCQCTQSVQAGQMLELEFLRVPFRVPCYLLFLWTTYRLLSLTLR